MNTKQIWFLCHPYINDPEGNVEKSIEITNKLLDLGYCVFNPIGYTHELHKEKWRHEDFWYDFDFKFLDVCSGIIMCDSWKESKGCKAEYKRAVIDGLEVKYLKDILKMKEMGLI